jgi:hypothetical protein
MSNQEEFDELKGRIVELENKLSKGSATRESAAGITAEEIQAFEKVRDVIASDWGEFCGINDCYRCIVVQRCVTTCIKTCYSPCIYECTCGPCNIGGFGGGNVGRFGGLGG